MKEAFEMEDDRLRALLEEWRAPEPPAEMDGRVRATFRAAHPPVWRSIWTARITVPVPVLAALVLIVLTLLVALRPAPPGAPTMSRYVTRLSATGFQPVPNGEARIVKIGEIKQ